MLDMLRLCGVNKSLCFHWFLCSSRCVGRDIEVLFGYKMLFCWWMIRRRWEINHNLISGYDSYSQQHLFIFYTIIYSLICQVCLNLQYHQQKEIKLNSWTRLIKVMQAALQSKFCSFYERHNLFRNWAWGRNFCLENFSSHLHIFCYIL